MEAAEQRQRGRRRRARRRGRSAAAAAGSAARRGAQPQRGVPREARRGRRSRRTRGAASSSRTAHGRQVSRSAGVGLLAGGAQRTAAVIQASRSARPSSRVRPRSAGWRSPARCSAANRKSPERSPVNTRPVRLAPCAAGARPRISTRAAGSPKPGIGRPQYVSSANAARFSRATSSRHATSRGQRRQATISRLELRQAARRSTGAARSSSAEDQPLDHRLAGRARAPGGRCAAGARRARPSRRRSRTRRRRRRTRRAAARAPCARCRASMTSAKASSDRVAALGRARAGADDLDEQRLRVLAVLGRRVEERAQPGADALVVVPCRARCRGLAIAASTSRRRRRRARGCTPPCWRSARRRSPSTCRPRG